MKELLIPGVVTIIVTTISGYFGVKVVQASKEVKQNAVVASNGASVATEKSDELKDALDLLHSMNRRLTVVEQERDECRQELKMTREHNKELTDMLGMSKSRSSSQRLKKS